MFFLLRQALFGVGQRFVARITIDVTNIETVKRKTIYKEGTHMSRIKSFPVKTDELGGFQEANRLESELIYLSLGVDGAERRTYDEEPFAQGSEFEFDEFH